MTRRKVSRKAAVDKFSVWLPIPEQFLTVMDDGWAITLQDGIHSDIGLLQVLIYTVRRLPVKDAGDAERSLEVLQILKAADEDEAVEYLELRRTDYDWVINQLREHCHKLWAAPDSAYLRHWLQDNLLSNKPSTDPAKPSGPPREGSDPTVR
jgi:hypothetical protein